MSEAYSFPFFCCCLVDEPCPTLYDPIDCSMPGFPVLHYLPGFAQTHVHWVSGAVQPSHPLLPPSPPALNLSQHQELFPVNWLFPLCGHSIGASASFLLMNSQGWFPSVLTGLILLSKGILKCLLQYNSKISVLWHSAFFMIQLSHLYMTTRKTIMLTIWTFVTKVMSLLLICHLGLS